MSYYQQIYNRLRQDGLSEAGALGCLGNWDCESNCEPYRVQGDFSSYRSISKAYVNALTTGQMTKYAFAHDSKGFGLAQWTYPTRKDELYDYWKQSSLPIDSAVLQTDFAVKEMKRDYPNLYSYLCTTRDIYEACSRVCKEFERPAVNNIDARFQAATRIKHEINLNAWETDSPEEPTEDDTPKTEYWPPRVIDKNMNGYDVMVLQAVLKARGYPVTEIDGQFGSYLEEQVKRFQRDSGLVADGVVDNLTWGKLLERK